jgi:hypothetical protein
MWHSVGVLLLNLAIIFYPRGFTPGYDVGRLWRLCSHPEGVRLYSPEICRGILNGRRRIAGIGQVADTRLIRKTTPKGCNILARRPVRLQTENRRE